MGRLLLLLADLTFIVIASFLAVVLRENFDVPDGRYTDLMPYLALTLLVAVPVLVGLGLNRGIWRLSAMPDYSRVIFAVAIIVVSAVVLGFIFNRQEGIARSLPILQAILMAIFMIGIRVLIRARHGWRQRHKRKDKTASAAPELPGARNTVLVVGINKVAELYIQSVREFAEDHISIAGLLGRSDRHTGRLVQQHEVLGRPEEVVSVLQDLELHGVFVNQIVLATAFTKLTPDARQALLEIQKSANVKLLFFAETLGLDGGAGRGGAGRDALAAKTALEKARANAAFKLSPDEMASIAQRPYWRTKRIVDAVGAGLLLILLAPVTLIVALLVALDVGLPVVFWQQRPGAKGKPFWLYKLRSMAASHDADGQRIPDDQRSSPIGRFIRRTRLDELPQLWNILVGDMSFVGPRPLLPIDQPSEFSLRLMVRPGLTGWAQVQGGRKVSPSDKAALDIWYVCNASPLLDVKIALQTIPIILYGEQTNDEAVRQAWEDLEKAGICAMPPR